MNTQKDAIIIVLNFIQEQENVKESFIQLGYNFSEVETLLEKLMVEELLEVTTDDKYILTQKAAREIELFKSIKPQHWIEPEKKSKTSKIKKNRVYLPSRDELSF